MKRCIFWAALSLEYILLALCKKSTSICKIKRINGEKIRLEKFMSTYRDKEPVILRNMIRHWNAVQTWTKDEFSRRYGHLRVALERQVSLSSAPTNEGLVLNMTIGEYINVATQHDIALSFDSYEIRQALYNDVAPTPPVLHDIIAEPVFSLGRRGTGADFHFHEETWLAQIVGRKLWFTAPPEMPGIEELRGMEPCMFRNHSEKVHSICTIAPGDVLYLPSQWFHATCNLDDLTVGVGGRGETTPVHEACGRCSQPALVDSLNHARPDSLDSFGRHPLYVCASSGCVDGARRLLMHSSVDVGSNVTYLDGGQPLHAAAKSGHVPMVSILIEHKASLAGRDDKGYQPIHIATSYGKAHAMIALIDRRASLSSRDSHGNQPIHVAATSGHIEIVEELINQRSVVGASNLKASQPLHFAAYKGHASVVELLVERRSLLSAIDGRGGKPIDWAVAGGHDTVVEILAELETRTGKSIDHEL